MIWWLLSIIAAIVIGTLLIVFALAAVAIAFDQRNRPEDVDDHV